MQCFVRVIEIQMHITPTSNQDAPRNDLAPIGKQGIVEGVQSNRISEVHKGILEVALSAAINP